MTPEQAKTIVEQLWEQEKEGGNVARIAEAAAAAVPLPAFATVVEPLPKLLADLQKRSFVHGVTAALVALERYVDLEIAFQTNSKAGVM